MSGNLQYPERIFAFFERTIFLSKQQSRDYNLTEGNILNKLLLVALPIMGTQLMQMTYNLTDMYWLGRLSSDAVASSGTAGMYLWLSQAFLMIARMGAEIGVAQSIGRGDKETAKLYSQNSIFLGIVLGLLYGGALVVLKTPLIGFFAIKEANVAADASAYLAWVALGIPMTFITAAVSGTFNASGNSRTPFIINSVGLVANMILDPLLISTFNMGIVGAAIATISAQAVVCVLSLIALAVHKDRPFDTIKLFVRPDSEIIKQIFKWCIPIGLENMLFTFLTMLISRFTSSFGSQAIAIQRIGSQIESLSWLLGAGLGSAFTTFIGQNYGAGRFSRIHRGYKITLGFGMAWGVIVTAILFFAGGPLYTFFVKEDDIIALGGQFLKILALCQLPQSFESVSAGAFKGMGKTIPPTVNSIACNAIRVPLAYFMSITSLGLMGIWIAVTIGSIMRGMSIFTWYLVYSRKLPRDDIEHEGEPAHA